jgi:outer membrane lipoprotein SlyB
MGEGIKSVKEANFMMVKRLMILWMVAVFTLGVVGLSFSAQEIKGTVSKIEGDRLTILDDTGKDKTVKIKDPESLKEIKVGDRVLVKAGKVTKEST